MRACRRFVLDLFVAVADTVELDLPNGTTRLVNNNQYTRAGQTVDNQVTNLGDPTNPNAYQAVGAEGCAMTSDGGLAAPFRINNASPTTNIVKASAGRVC